MVRTALLLVTLVLSSAIATPAAAGIVGDSSTPATVSVVGDAATPRTGGQSGARLSADGRRLLDGSGTRLNGDGTSFVTGSATHPSIVAAHPNPVAHEDATEFVVLSVPDGVSLDAYVLTDGDRSVPLPAVESSGRVAITTAPRRVANLTDHRVVETNASLSLANGGETLRLLRNGTVVSRVTYRDAPEGEVAGWGDAERGVTWRPLGRTDHAVVHGRNATVTTFALPDAPGVVSRVLENADERILLAGYTFTSRRLADELIAAHRRGVRVRLLLEGDPVGSVSRRQARVLDRLVAAGIEVRLLTGPRTRYAYHHAKYAVVDDRALVLTENFKPAGTGGHSSRGWGVVVEESSVVTGLAETYRADASWVAAKPWSVARRGRTFETAGRANGTYPSQFAPRTIEGVETDLLVTPDNAERRLVALLDGANESIRVVQMSIDDRRGPLVRATLRAARRGVEVKVLLSGAWYTREHNQEVVTWLNEKASEQDLPLEARLADSQGHYEKIHAKGVVVDGRHVVLGSLNWNAEALQENREVVVVLSSQEVASYYGGVFASDWGDRTTGLPVGLIAAVGGVVLLAALVARRFDFECSDDASGPGDQY